MTKACDISVTILGCGSSGGVPRIGDHWGVCDPLNPKNRRRRCSILIQGHRIKGDASTNILVDTGADMREQLLDAQIDDLHAVIYTHEHADHTHGIDDLRVLALSQRRRMDVYLTEQASQRIFKSFRYCFQTPEGSPYPPILNAHLVGTYQKLHIDGPGGTIDVQLFEQVHGDIITLGIRVNNFAYSCDVSNLDRKAVHVLKNLDVWVVDALRPTPHVSHFSLSDALHWIARLKPTRAYLTNLHVDMDYDTVQQQTPDHVAPAYDGLVIEI